MRPDQSNEIELSVSEFVALHNQVLEYSMPVVTIVGELSSFRISKNRWVYFDLKDEEASVKFFGTVYQLSGPLEDGMLLKVRGTPRVHPQFGFSITILSIQLAGEGTLRRAFDLLQQKLVSEGLFDPARKRTLPYPPSSIGVITSKESAAYADFVKILGARWGGMDITLANVQVQGEPAPRQIVEALTAFNQLAQPPEVLVITRGGGSAEDLWAFNTEQVTRAIAGSRIPTLVAIGHEVDISLAELAADQRASTPSNAAELLTPDRRAELAALQSNKKSLMQLLQASVQTNKTQLLRRHELLDTAASQFVKNAGQDVARRRQFLTLLSPATVLRRGYAIVRDKSGAVVRSKSGAVRAGDLAVEFGDGTVNVRTKE
jgi:exodeoxyribonuclease VII large subunit